MKSILIFWIFGFLWKNVFAQNYNVFTENYNVFTALYNFTCVPATDCMNIAFPGVLVPDPVDCEYYYKCVQTGPTTYEPTLFATKCPEGQYFDQNLGNCSPEDIPGTCINDCFGNQNPGCPSSCPPSDGLIHVIADKSNCSNYYVCLPSPALQSCPSEYPYFDGITCGKDCSQCCNPCVPVCSSTSYQIQDPCNCTYFYYCVNGVPSDRTYCGPGAYYNETVNNCVIGVCNSTCSSLYCGNNVLAKSACDSPVATPTTVIPTTVTTGKPPATTTTPPPDGCKPTSSFSCPSSNGNFPRCPYCANSFFHCENNVATVSYCLPNEVFNTNLGYPYCLAPQDCPFPR